MEYLRTTYLDALKVKIDRQTVALASTFSVNPNSVALHGSDNLSNHVTVGTLTANGSAADVTGICKPRAFAVVRSYPTMHYQTV